MGRSVARALSLITGIGLSMRHTHCPGRMHGGIREVGFPNTSYWPLLLSYAGGSPASAGGPHLLRHRECERRCETRLTRSGNRRAPPPILWRIAGGSNTPLRIEYLPINLNVADIPPRWFVESSPSNDFDGDLQNSPTPTRFSQYLTILWWGPAQRGAVLWRGPSRWDFRARGAKTSWVFRRAWIFLRIRQIFYCKFSREISFPAARCA